MSFVDGIFQYQANTASNTNMLSQVKGGGRVLSVQGQELVPGKVFEGTVTEMKNGQVTIGLSDGKAISARMEQGVDLVKGQPMLFEVKANTGEQISIRPVTLESAQNPTLMKALEAAGLKANPRNLSMVNQMMMEQLPIDKSSLMQMARAVGNFPQADMQTLVQMQKLGFTIDENTLNQFQNYKNGQQAMLPDMLTLMEGIAELPEQAFGKEGIGAGANGLENIVLNPQGQEAASQGQNTGLSQMLGLQQQIVEILLGGDPGAQGAAPSLEEGLANGVFHGEPQGEVSQGGQVIGQPGQGMQDVTMNNTVASERVIGQPGQEMQGQAGSALDTGMAGQSGGVSDTGMAGQASQLSGQDGQMLVQGSHASGQDGQMFVQGSQAPGQDGQISGQASQASASAGQVSGQGMPGSAGDGLHLEAEEPPSPSNIDHVLNRGQQNALSSILQEFSGARDNELLLPNGRLNANLSAGELLQQIMGAVKNTENASGDLLKKLFSSKEYKGILKQAMADQWLLSPESLKEEGAVKELYQRMSRQLEQLQQALSQTGKEGAALGKTAQSLQSNIEFMNQMNQAYAYAQLPLKLRNQNAHSDLYVYTNKKNLREKGGELSALLHLDLDHLGSTDIFVKMKGMAVQTEFYLENGDSYRLIAGFTDRLVEQLQNKGYQCQVKVENRPKQQDFVEDFLERDKPNGKLHRYSFDVKA